MNYWQCHHNQGNHGFEKLKNVRMKDIYFKQKLSIFLSSIKTNIIPTLKMFKRKIRSKLPRFTVPQTFVDED